MNVASEQGRERKDQIVRVPLTKSLIAEISQMANNADQSSSAFDLTPDLCTTC